MLPSLDTAIDLAALRAAAEAALAEITDPLQDAIAYHGAATPEQLVATATGKPSWSTIAGALIHGPQSQPALFALALARLIAPASATHDGDLEITTPTIIAGDLHVRGNLQITSALWVLGTLRCDGLVRDCGPDSHVVVAHDLFATGVRASGELCVLRDLDARVVQGVYNDNSLVIAGDLDADIVFEDDHDVVVCGVERVKAHAKLDMSFGEQLATIERWLAPGFLRDEALDIDALVAALVRGEPAILAAPRA